MNGMASGILVLLYLGSVGAQTADFTISAKPNTVFLGGPEGNQNLRISCGPSMPDVTTVFQMAIGRKDSAGSDMEISRINTGTPDTPTITDMTFGSRLKVFGSVAPKHQKLEIELSPVNCEDAVTYYCKAVFLTSHGSVGQSEVEVEVRAITIPYGLNLTMNPDEDKYEIGTNLTFTCTGMLDITTDLSNPSNHWSWRTRNSSSEPWEDVNGDVTFIQPRAVDNCTYFAETDLNLVVTEEMDGQQVLCELAGKIYESKEITVKPKPTPAGPVYLMCDEIQLLSAVSQKETVSNDSAGLCSNGRHEMSEAVPMEFCSAPDTTLWKPGPAVLDVCDTLPLHTPIATFQFGMFVNNNAGLSGIFMGCSDSGFTMATQICGHPVDLYHLAKGTASLSEVEDPKKYHVVFIKDQPTRAKPILIG